MQEGAARDGGFILVEWGAYFEGGGGVPIGVRQLIILYGERRESAKLDHIGVMGVALLVFALADNWDI